MGKSRAPDIFDSIVDPLIGCLDAESARRVADFQIASIVQDRVDELAEGANEGTLSKEELDEYDGLIVIGDFLSLLRISARRSLKLADASD